MTTAGAFRTGPRIATVGLDASAEGWDKAEQNNHRYNSLLVLRGEKRERIVRSNHQRRVFGGGVEVPGWEGSALRRRTETRCRSKRAGGACRGDLRDDNSMEKDSNGWEGGRDRSEKVEKIRR